MAGGGRARGPQDRGARRWRVVPGHGSRRRRRRMPARARRRPGADPGQRRSEREGRTMKLLVDLGNSRLKLARLGAHGVEPIATWAHGNGDAGTHLESALAGAGAADSVWIADVARAEV